MSELKDEILTLIDEQPTTMSKYQIDNFVINEKMTDYKILKQILLELGSRYTSYDNLLIDIEIAELEYDILESELDPNNSSKEEKIKQLQLKKKKNDLNALNKTRKNHEYEIEILEENFKKLKDRIKIDPKNLLEDETGEEIYWANKFIKEAQIDIMTTGRIGKGVLDAIFMLPSNLQEVIINNAITQATNNNGFIATKESDIINIIKEDKQVSLMLNSVLSKKEE